jgi:uncharacterized repeat protein (TIGR03803 family)
MWKSEGIQGTMAGCDSPARSAGSKIDNQEIVPTVTLARSFPSPRVPVILFTVAFLLVSSASAEWKEKVLYSFQGGANDGASPAGGVVFDKAGNLYGATDQGGGECPPAQCGTVFQLAPPAKKGDPWTETVLHVFKGNASGDGNTPVGSVIIDSLGNLYGTTGYGGTGNCVLLGTKVGCGTVYELSPPKQKGGAWAETVLYSFPTPMQGYLPNGDLVFDSAGNLYGATMFGGGHGTTCNAYYQYCGAVFELSPPKQEGGKWTEKVLHGFKGGMDGANPNGGLVFDSTGAIYGTTYGGGFDCPYNSGMGCGTVFKLAPPRRQDGSWTETVLHRFKAISDGILPAAGLTPDKKGSFYGTTGLGGEGNEEGTVFKLDSRPDGTWKKHLLYSFQGQNDGSNPRAPVVLDAKGNLYGTATSGGGSNFAGTVFQLAKNPSGRWVFAAVYSFDGVNNGDGAFPSGNIVLSAGNIFGTTEVGGTGSSCQGGCGTVFEMRP